MQPLLFSLAWKRNKQSRINSLCFHVLCNMQWAKWNLEMGKIFGSKNSDGSWPVCAEVTITRSHCSMHRKQTAGGPKHAHDEGLREPSLGDVLIFSSGMWKGLFWTASVLLFVFRSFKKGVTRSDGPPGGSRDSSFPWRADEQAWGLGGRRRRIGGAPRLLQGLVGRREEKRREWEPCWGDGSLLFRRGSWKERGTYAQPGSLGDRKKTS